MPVVPGIDCDCCGGGGGSGECACFQHDDECLQDVNGIFWRRTQTAPDGTVTVTFVDTAGDPYVPSGAVGPCGEDFDFDDECLQDDNGVFFRRAVRDDDGNYTIETVDVAGDPYVPVGNVVACGSDIDVQKQLLCDDVDGTCAGRVQFERHWTYTDGVLTGTYDTDLDANPYVVVGDVVDCHDNCMDCCPTIIAEGCYPDENGDTQRWITIYDDTTSTARTFDPRTGQPVNPNLMGECPDPIRQVQKQLLCDDDGNGTTQFERHFEYDSGGLFMGTTDTDLDGNPYTVVGTVVSCQDERHIVQSELLCDESANQFERHFVYSNLGALLSTFDTDLDGNPYEVFGDVVPCTSIIDDAEWVTIGEGCWDDGGGNSGRYTAIRDQSDGSVILVDSVTGVQLSPLLIVDCEKCCITAIANGCWDDGEGGTGAWVSLYDDDTSTATLIDPVTGDPVDPADVVECPAGFTETSTLSTADASTVNLPTGQLTAWEVRHISGTVDLTVNGDTVTMQSGEVIGSSAQDGDLLDDTVVVDATAGVARIIFKQRI